MSMRYVDGQLFFNDLTMISTNQKSARRIISHLITKRQDFSVMEMDGEWFIFLDTGVDLERLRAKLANIKFELAT